MAKLAAALEGDQYREELEAEWERFKKGEITREEFQAAERDIWDKFLTRKHLRDNANVDIFIKVFADTKERYASWKDDYYCAATIDRGEYLRGITGDDGAGYYDRRLVDLGLASRRWTETERDRWLWKAYNLERQFLPEAEIKPTDPVVCPRGMPDASREILRVAFESIDDFHQRLVPTLPDKFQLRDKSWIQIEAEEAAFSVGYSDVEPTAREIQQYEQFRRETGPAPSPTPIRKSVRAR